MRRRLLFCKIFRQFQVGGEILCGAQPGDILEVAYEMCLVVEAVIVRYLGKAGERTLLKPAQRSLEACYARQLFGVHAYGVDEPAFELSSAEVHCGSECVYARVTAIAYNMIYTPGHCFVCC